MIRLNDILQRVASYHPDPDLDIIKKAYVYSAKVHQGQLRKSGEPYLIHPLEVAGILAELKLDEASIVTGLLHDTIEDTLATAEELTELFGPEVAQLVDGVTKLSKFSASATLSQEEKQAENFRKMIIAMAQDIRVILVKLADRTHNMRTLDHMSEEKQARIGQETLDIYAPLANRLGISWIKTELEDLSFRYVKPQEFFALEEQLNKRKKEREAYIEDTCDLMRAKLQERGLKGDVSGRFKHVYSIWKKIKSQGIDFDQIHDIIAFRIIAPAVPACYEALGMVHQMWKPVPGRFKDFIAIPKPNMYQSLHTTVIGPLSERVEVQIRTAEMHKIAEEGIAAHWAYKEGRAPISKDDEKFAWLRQLMEWQQDLKDPKEFLETVKVDLFTDEVFVFTPKGDVRSLPRGATPVDFAYAIHSDVGGRCVGAKVNGKIVPLRYKLKNGDTVEVLTSPQAHPSKDWLTFVKTSRAQQRIRGFIKQQQRDKSLQLGRELVEREFKRFQLNFNKQMKSGELKKVAEELGFRVEDDLLVAIGYGKVTPQQLVQRIVPQEKLAQAEPPPRPDASNGNGNGNGTGNTSMLPGLSRMTDLAKRLVGRNSRSGVQIGGVDDVLVRFGRCCNPVPGDPIAGFITRGRGVTVHTVGCEKALATDPERRVDVSWDVKGDFKRPVTLRVLTADRPGLLADITHTFSKKSVNISQANCRATGDDRAVNTFEVTISDLKQLTDLMRSIERLTGVYSVERI
ncbi:bifunctional (p)ppGpp synthetase/guanosine-3',5'-bis(diphosphate) 3'-pyrophosphohydrolase [Corallococcus praedator]|uniref:Bifunctional (P)ppGpp synthetase/guanosine-3',5'-bis(Diphosphate) 3'-pyrophosphohydrolase n=1 Tax=Corallococcus praedator TaxID=2316724 RepID=A0ABX9QL77_9BACT|nr:MULTISPECIES: bifunctional (p)ppGpp synthetase/guanosine-3',5'-bis(diphosphate) 3'-pyrophosphohydrolase [Corallococcus]RKH22603.1 bifunctional (p)ppGpp synthetase/guanosine-3',5'-bis(diphosphate) 3'-pyrophosphohydrolase [Corallococcus sp. CA031C]RKI11749.1 bifunctional (p)ppGpp synthetase/guanosine-3',5'-bis(diphosphate) 3'-pyrophosphohydrolase [Corallococcus praedator]